jgi:hypothetical protein
MFQDGTNHFFLQFSFFKNVFQVLELKPDYNEQLRPYLFKKATA